VCYCCTCCCSLYILLILGELHGMASQCHLLIHRHVHSLLLVCQFTVEASDSSDLHLRSYLDLILEPWRRLSSICVCPLGVLWEGYLLSCMCVLLVCYLNASLLVNTSCSSHPFSVCHVIPPLGGRRCPLSASLLPLLCLSDSFSPVPSHRLPLLPI